MPLELAGLSDPFGRAAAELEAVGLGHRLTHYPAQLSGGEQQRVAIARAPENAPALLLADEPTGNLDTRTGRDVMETLERLNAERAVAVVIVTHDREIASRAQRQIHVRDGRIQFDNLDDTATATP